MILLRRSKDYRRMVTLSVPMLPLVSNVRSEIVCSPGPRPPNSIVYVSCPLSAMPSSGKTGTHAAPSNARYAQVTVNFGTSGGSVKVQSGNACGYSAFRTKTVTINCRETLSLATGRYCPYYLAPTVDSGWRICR